MGLEVHAGKLNLRDVRKVANCAASVHDRKAVNWDSYIYISHCRVFIMTVEM
jgi:hypothetical protein